MLLWVSVIFVSFYISTQNIRAKKQFKDRFHSNGTVSFLYNNRPPPNVYILTLYVPRIPHQFALDWRPSTLIRWKWSPETRHFKHTLHGGNLRKFQEVQRFCVGKATFWNITMTPNLDLTLSTSLKLHLLWMATIHNLSNCVQPSREALFAREGG